MKTGAYTVIKKEEMPVSQWSGGSTTEIFIYPAGASYAKRDFLFRISTAYIRDKESEFTSLTGIQRVILPLSDEITLAQEGVPVRVPALQPFHFDGGVKTHCKGSGWDLNLMTQHCKGEVSLAGSTITPQKECFTALYPLEGMTVHIRDETIVVSAKDLFLLHTQDEFIIEANAPVVKFEVIL